MLEEGDPQLTYQGEADRYAQRSSDHPDPISHLGAYERSVAVSFRYGSEEHHVPPDPSVFALPLSSELLRRLSSTDGASLLSGIAGVGGVLAPSR